MFTCWLEYPPKLAVANLVNSLKGVSVRLLRKERPDILKRYCKAVLWSASCFASSCGGAPILIVRHYIEQQQTPQPKDGYAVRAILPRPKPRGWSRTRSKVGEQCRDAQCLRRTLHASHTAGATNSPAI